MGVSESRLDAALNLLRTLNESVPTPTRLPTEDEVDAAELRTGIRFHPDMRRYLLDASDVVFGWQFPVTLVGDWSNFEETLESARAYGVPAELVPVCEDNADFYCITATGEVVFWSHNGDTDESWPDLATWITDVWIGGN